MAVLRAVVSTPSVPVLVIRHDPRRQPSADVVVVAGAVGAVPVGLAAGDPEPVGVAVSDGDGLGVPVPEVDADGLSVAGADEPDGAAVAEVDAELEPRPLICPQTAPAIRPTTAVIARATRTIATGGMEPPSSRRRGITATP